MFALCTLQILIKKQCVYLGDYTAVRWSRSDKDDLQQIACVQRYLNYKLVKNDESTKNICLICCNLVKKNFPLYNTQYIDELPLILIFALVPWIVINKSYCLHHDGQVT
jgi:hypothetical protein